MQYVLCETCSHRVICRRKCTDANANQQQATGGARGRSQTESTCRECRRVRDTFPSASKHVRVGYLTAFAKVNCCQRGSERYDMASCIAHIGPLTKLARAKKKLPDGGEATAANVSLTVIVGCGRRLEVGTNHGESVKRHSC